MIGKMTFEEYMRWHKTTDRGSSALERGELGGQLAYAGLKLGGEAGEVQELIGKSFRDGAEPISRAKVVLELGDVLWYVTKIAKNLGMSIEDVARINRMKIDMRNKTSKNPVAELAMAEEQLTIHERCTWCCTEYKQSGWEYCSNYCASQDRGPE